MLDTSTVQIKNEGPELRVVQENNSYVCNRNFVKLENLIQNHFHPVLRIRICEFLASRIRIRIS